MRAGRVGGVAMNGGSLHEVALALAEPRTLDSVLQTIVRGLAEYSEVGAALVRLVKSGPNLIIYMCSMHVR